MSETSVYVRAALVLLLVTVPVFAHHGTSISYDGTKAFNTEAVVTEFRYANPHPQIFFDVTGENGNVAHWSAEIQTDVGRMVRAGWTRARSMEALKPGTRIKLRISPSLAGGPYGLATRIQSDKGEPLLCLGGCEQSEPLK